MTQKASYEKRKEFILCKITSLRSNKFKKGRNSYLLNKLDEINKSIP